jgi:hypothetical protein
MPGAESSRSGILKGLESSRSPCDRLFYFADSPIRIQVAHILPSPSV